MNLAWILGIARLCAGAVIFLLPRQAGWLFGGDEGRSSATTIFARGFAARDMAIGGNMLNAARNGDSTQPWLVSAAIADLADALAVLLVWRDLPARHRIIAFVASLVPAIVEGWAIREQHR